ncbi:stage V sporulation protein AA [Bacillus sp. FJAT-27251]|uniref:stage V sporulation protein AA n=1 Tax=Bacillus sp. FJAT-27251 TaxID=1684142 RepID=UPI0006A7EE3D|nr:stage V sporulation protein AA [Bacillus sp. FJAT-27251]
MENTIYIRLRHRVQVKPEESLLLKDIAQIISNDEIHQRLNMLHVHKVTPQDKNIVIIDVMKVISVITSAFPNHEVQAVGPAQTIIEVMLKKKAITLPLFLLIWMLLFTGAALTIMNFHEDVSMQEVHQRIYTILTGEEASKPLLFQIPYSFGLGLGMILFFNHVFRKRLNEEPSPLEVEMFQYQQSLDQYVVMNENKESMKHLDDD